MKRVIVFVLSTFAMSFIVLKADCPPNIEDWDCYEWTYPFGPQVMYDCDLEDPYNPLCHIHFEYCIRYRIDENGLERREVYIDKWWFDPNSGDCSCVEPEQLIMMYAFQEHISDFNIETSGTYGFEVFTAPCWKTIFDPFPMSVSCETEACCFSKYNVSYLLVIDPPGFDFHINDVVFTGADDPYEYCEEPCVAYCDDFVFLDYLWEPLLNYYGGSSSPKISGQMTSTILDDSKEIIVHPNPSNGIISISIEIDDENIQSLSIFESNGKYVKSIETSSINNESIIDISYLASGEYYIRLITNNDIKYKKIVIAK